MKWSGYGMMMIWGLVCKLSGILEDGVACVMLDTVVLVVIVVYACVL